MDEGDRRGVDRLTIQEAARRLGVSEGAVRKRVTRGTLQHDKAEDGRVYVYLDTGVDDGVDDGVDPNSNALISRLENEVAFLRDQVHRQQEIIAQQAVTMRQIAAAPSEPLPDERESPQTVEEEPDRGEPHAATEGAQEGTAHPQQSGWLAPVDKLPWWHYVLGLLLVFSGGSLWSALVAGLPPAPNYFVLALGVVAISGFPPGIFGFWVGYRKRNLRLWSHVLPLGVLVGALASLGLNLFWQGLQVLLLNDSPAHATAYVNSPLGFFTYVVLVSFAAWLLFVSASLVGNTWQRRRIGRISGTTPASPVSRTRQGAAQQPRKDLTPAQQAMLGWGGTIIAAIITLVGTIILGRGGP